jgi:hypothetical protein
VWCSAFHSGLNSIDGCVAAARDRRPDCSRDRRPQDQRNLPALALLRPDFVADTLVINAPPETGLEPLVLPLAEMEYAEQEVATVCDRHRHKWFGKALDAYR